LSDTIPRVPKKAQAKPLSETAYFVNKILATTEQKNEAEFYMDNQL
jgi:hypothetical protein